MPPRILLLSGFACTAQIWERAEFGPDTHAARVDWPPDLTPGFHQIDDFADWLAGQYPLSSYDAIIGHSMGGLAAVRLLVKTGLRVGRLVLVESFLRPPGPFFQNLLMPDAAPELVDFVTGMLKAQRSFYSSALAQSLRTADLYAESALPDVPIHAVYGDRGSPNPGEAISALGWPEDLSARIPVTLIPRACHFPMLENPGRMGAALRELLG